MSLQDTPAAERAHVAFFGVRNVGKSSVVNAVTGQELSIVSDIKGTTTDPVQKTMEILPIGPVVIIDTPGIDDTGSLGEERVRRTKKVLDKTDLAVLVVSAEEGLQKTDSELIDLFRKKQIPFLIAVNKCDLATAGRPEKGNDGIEATGASRVLVSAKTGEGIHELKEAMGRLIKDPGSGRPLVGDLVSTGDLVILVIPIDKSAPKGRLILPQQMVIRGLLDAGARPLLVRDTEYLQTIEGLCRPETDGADAAPALVITDSQIFARIAEQTPEEIPLTSFSMIMARYKGGLEEAVAGARKIEELRDGDRVLISEGCTHHRQCEDIGTVKIPGWLEAYTGKKPDYAFTSGGDFPEELKDFALVIHCGGCMLNEREMRSRLRHARDEGVSMTNYGVAIAQMNGILERCCRPLLADPFGNKE